MDFLSGFGKVLGEASAFTGGVWGGIKSFFGSSFGEIHKGFSEGIGWEEEKRKEEERRRGMTKGLTGEELEKAQQDDWNRMASKAYSPFSFPRKMSSSMLLTGEYRR